MKWFEYIYVIVTILGLLLFTQYLIFNSDCCFNCGISEDTPMITCILSGLVIFLRKIGGLL